MSKNQSRRRFLTGSIGGICGLGLYSMLPPMKLTQAQETQEQNIPESSFVKEARFYKKLKELKIECQLCPRGCSVADLERGYCGCRENRGGTYYTLVYSRPCALHVDPIEKKPLFHYLPGTNAFSLATAGCNIECKFCQNWNISQFRPEQVKAYYVPPQKVVELSKEYDCPTIAYTYSEPVVFYEYMYDIAALAKQKKIGSVIISNGYIHSEPLKELCQQLTGVKIDLKAFTEKFYKEYCSGELKPVLDTLLLLKKIGIWFEIVVLLIPNLNDEPSEIEQMTKWIKAELGPDIPVHFTRYYPTYKITNIPPTSVKTLERAQEIAKKNGLHYAYVGNVPGHPGEHTYCPKCGKKIIERTGFKILQNHINQGRCAFCQEEIPGVWTNPL
jgi:pyruvate formate lyase activating enzyme